MDFSKDIFCEAAVRAFSSLWEASYVETLATKEAPYSTLVLCKNNFWKCLYVFISVQSLRVPPHYFHGSALFDRSILHMPASFYSTWRSSWYSYQRADFCSCSQVDLRVRTPCAVFIQHRFGCLWMRKVHSISVIQLPQEKMGSSPLTLMGSRIRMSMLWKKQRFCKKSIHFKKSDTTGK